MSLLLLFSGTPVSQNPPPGNATASSPGVVIRLDFAAPSASLAVASAVAPTFTNVPSIQFVPSASAVATLPHPQVSAATIEPLQVVVTTIASSSEILRRRRVIQG